MLRTGIYLLSSSSLGVVYRMAELPYAMLPAFKWVCLAGLSISLFCFTCTYIRIYSLTIAKSDVRRTHMIKSAEWNTSPQA